MVTRSYENILGYPITTHDKAMCLKQMHYWIDAGEQGRYIACVNPHSLMVARSDSLFKQALLNADLLTPDGTGILLASRVLGSCRRDRITGSDVFWGLSQTLNRYKQYRYFFLGATEDNLNRIRERMERVFPNIDVVGTFSPPFKDEFSFEETRQMIDRINRAAPHVLWVGMTAPKQEKWIYLNRTSLQVNVIAPVGAVFSFFGETVKRAHPWFQDHGLEWLSRLIKDPLRLWKRTLVSAPQFMLSIYMQRLFTKHLATSID